MKTIFLKEIAENITAVLKFLSFFEFISEANELGQEEKTSNIGIQRHRFSRV